MKRKYEITVMAEVVVDDQAGTVHVEVPLTGLPSDLALDHDYPPNDPQVVRDSKTISECLMASPSNFTMTHTMSKEA